MICLLAIFGIRLDFTSRTKTVFKLLLSALCCVLIVVNFIEFSVFVLMCVIVYPVAVANAVIAFRMVNPELGDEIARIAIKSSVMPFVHRAMVFFVPAIFTKCCASGEWKRLWMTLLKIQHELKLSKKFYEQCRRWWCYVTINGTSIVGKEIHRPRSYTNKRIVLCDKIYFCS